MVTEEGLCHNCHVEFGTWGGHIFTPLETSDMLCPACNDFETCILQPYCKHSLCAKCYKKCYDYNWKYDVEKPIFPYSNDIEDKWNNTLKLHEEIEKFVNEYPLMKKYIEENDKWHDDKVVYQKMKPFFGICPICKITENKYDQILENKEILRKTFNAFKKKWLMNKYNDSDDSDDNTINKYKFNGIINQDVKCDGKSCQKSMNNFNFGYIKYQLYFCDKPHVLCPECFNKKENNFDFIPYSYEHLLKRNPPWMKVCIDKKY